MNKKKAFLYSALALVSYLLFVVVQTPAERLYGLVKERLPLTLYQLDGTAWQGSATVATFGGRSQRLESLQWVLQPATIFLGRVQADVSFQYDNRDVSGTVGRDLGGLYLREFKGSLAAATLERLSPQLAFGLTGLFQFNLAELVLEGVQLASVEGEIQWHDAGLEMNNTSFGNFELSLATTDDGKINGVLRDLDGPLKVRGTLRLQPSGEYVFAGTLELRDNSRNDLRQGLRFVGTPNAKGVYTIKHQGKLPLANLAALSG